MPVFFATFRALEGILEGERKEEDLKQEYTDKSMVAAGFTILNIWEMLGVQCLWEWERIWGKERKEEDLARMNPTWS